MDSWDLALAALIKIVFLLLIVVGAFAPALVWAERRQSAMIQDRLGPRRANLPLPRTLVDMMKWSLGPLQMGIMGSIALSGFCVLTIVGMGVFGWDTVFAQTAESFYMGALGLAVLAGILAVGHKFHSTVVKNKGNIMLLGLLHPAADAIKMLWKEDFVPPKADKLLFGLAPVMTMIPAILSLAVIPFADTLYYGFASDLVFQGHAWGVVDAGPTMSDVAWVEWAQLHAGDSTALTEAVRVPMQVASLNIGVLFIFAVAGTGIIGAAIGGYASDNKYSLLGGLRAASQMVSYEVVLGLTLVPCFMVYDSVRLEDIALWQHEAQWWGIGIPPLTLACILYTFAAVAETKRIPFDAPEGESELVGGYLTEYSGMKFGMFFTGEYVEMAVLGGLAAIFFFGGWDVPFLYEHGFDLPLTWERSIPLTSWSFGDTILIEHWGVLTIQVVVFLLKIIFLMWVQMMIRWTLPRFRYDQIMALCWKGLLPMALINILFTGILVLLWS